MCFLGSGYKREEKKGDAGTNTSVKTYIGWIEGGASQWNGTVMGSEIQKMNPKIPCHRKHRFQLFWMPVGSQELGLRWALSPAIFWKLRKPFTPWRPHFLFVEREHSKQLMRLKYNIFFFCMKNIMKCIQCCSCRRCGLMENWEASVGHWESLCLLG